MRALLLLLVLSGCAYAGGQDSKADVYINTTRAINATDGGDTDPPPKKEPK